MKEDAPAPAHPPRKRYQLERVPDQWLAVWANDESLPEQERARAQEERETRKKAQPYRPVGVLIDNEGVSREQLDKLRELLGGSQATEIHHPWVASSVHTVCRSVGVPIVVHRDDRSRYKPMREVVLASAAIIAAPRARERVDNRTPAWDSIAYARHRKLPVKIVLPDGTTKETTDA